MPRSGHRSGPTSMTLGRNALPVMVTKLLARTMRR